LKRLDSCFRRNDDPELQKDFFSNLLGDKNMKTCLLVLLAIFFFASPLYASQSTIAEAEGLACMGYDKSKKQTEEEAWLMPREKPLNSPRHTSRARPA